MIYHQYLPCSRSATYKQDIVGRGSLKRSGLEGLVHVELLEPGLVKQTVLGEATLNEAHDKAGRVDGRTGVQSRHDLWMWMDSAKT